MLDKPAPSAPRPNALAAARCAAARCVAAPSVTRPPAGATGLIATLALTALVAGDARGEHGRREREAVQLGPRPYYLVDDLAPGPLKERLQRCGDGPFRRTDFSIGHRGAALMFPEHTRESYVAAARMGAGVLECDVTFTADKQLVCRHSQCDLHTTTNILAVPELAAKCSVPFTPADPSTGTPANAQCCTSDITLQEFLTLCGKMDAFNADATTPLEYLGGTPSFRTDLYATCGTLLSHAESIRLFTSLGTKLTPELKAPSVSMPFQGDFTQAAYAQALIDEYRAAHVPPSQVLPQSFNLADVLYWLEHEPAFGRRAILLDERVDAAGGYEAAVASLPELARLGVRIVAPPTWALVELDDAGHIVPSSYARAAKAAGLDLITWTLERSGPLASGGGYYYQSVQSAVRRDSDALVLLDVLARQVGVRGVFSDWPATVTYYANCLGL